MSTRPSALWLPFQVPELDPARDFYTERAGLSIVDEWDRGGERGVVLAAGAAYVELVAPGRPGTVPLAFQLVTPAAVDAAFATWRPAAADLLAPPHRYPRGHRGFEVAGPAGARIMIWSET